MKSEVINKVRGKKMYKKESILFYLDINIFI